jgi:hypothetical protein
MKSLVASRRKISMLGRGGGLVLYIFSIQYVYIYRAIVRERDHLLGRLEWYQGYPLVVS